MQALNAAAHEIIRKKYLIDLWEADVGSFHGRRGLSMFCLCIHPLKTAHLNFHEKSNVLTDLKNKQAKLLSI